MTLGLYAKALVAGVTAFGGAFATAASDGTVTVTEWVAVAVTTVVAAAAVFSVPNAKESEDTHA